MPDSLIELTVCEGTETIGTYRLGPGTYEIGREESCPIVAAVAGVSRRHARLTIRSADEVVIEDLGSANGTFVGGHVTAGEVRLWSGQGVEIGQAIITPRKLKRVGPSDEVLPWQAEVRRRLPEDLRRDRRYAINRLVAQGGMGAVLDARDQTIRRRVAMKVILETRTGDDVARFIEEAQVTGQLEHPNIVPIYELGVDEHEQVYYTMKFVRGITLKKVLELIAEEKAATIKKYPLPVLLTVFQKVCDGLAFAHSRGVIHRDLKPENVMIGDFGEVLVMDWGLARSSETAREPAAAHLAITSTRTDAGASGGTLAGTVFGTPHFMAPEQAMGRTEELDARSDIFALGGILYSILTLQAPVGGATVEEILEKVVGGQVVPPAAFTAGKRGRDRAPERIVGGEGKPVGHLAHLPGGRVPDSLSAVAMKALALLPANRYQSVPDLQRDVEAYQGGFATTAERAGRWKQTVLLVKRHKTLSLAVASLLIICATFTSRVIAERNRVERSLDALREEAPTFLVLSRALLADGDLERALAKIGHALTLDPDNPDYLLARAHLLESTQRLPEAAAEYRRVLAARPGDASARLNLELLTRLLATHSQEPLPASAQDELLASLLAQNRGVEAERLSLHLPRDQQPSGAALLARLAFYTKQEGWARSRLQVSDGQLELDLSELRLDDLTALHGFPISKLNLAKTGLRDLHPLIGLLLVSLNLDACPISDLGPLRSLKLRELVLGSGALADLAPLRGMPLEKLAVHSEALRDLAPLRGSPLKQLDLSGCSSLADLEPLRDLHLRGLNLTRTAVADLRPLHAMPLHELDLTDANKIGDLSPLASHVTLKTLLLPAGTRADVSVLATLPKLQWVHLPAGASTTPWHSPRDLVDRYGFQNPAIQATRAALASAGLPELETSRIAIDIDLLLIVNLEDLPAVDVRSLRGLPIKYLRLGQVLDDDVGPLVDVPELISLTLPAVYRHVEALQSMPNLRFLSEKFVEEEGRAAQTVDAFFAGRKDELR